jgi:hypothetical protein
MAEPVRLHDLMSAVANAIVDAQDKVDRHQIEVLRHFFDPAGRPVSVKVALPGLGRTPGPTDGADGDNAQILSVPLLALVPMNLLQIKEFQVSFEVELGELSLRDGGSAEHAPTEPARAGAPLGVPRITGATDDNGSRLFEPLPPSPSLTVGLQASTSTSRGAMARVTMKLEALPQPEGMARLT